MLRQEQRVRRLTLCALVSGITAAIGCASEPLTPGSLSEPLRLATGPALRVACSDILLAVDPVNPVRPLDYIGVYLSSRLGGSELTLLGDHGEACGGAKDQEACLESTAERLRSHSGCPEDATVCPQLILTMQGDEVLLHDQPETLARVLGDVDTASEAVLLAQLHGLYAACAPSNAPDHYTFGTIVQQTSAGWRVQSRGDQCGSNNVDQSIELRGDGTSNGFDYDIHFSAGCATTGG